MCVSKARVFPENGLRYTPHVFAIIAGFAAPGSRCVLNIVLVPLEKYRPIHRHNYF